MKRLLFVLLLISGVASAQTIDTVLTTDTPNQGRVKINAMMQRIYGYPVDTAGISTATRPIFVLQGDSVWVVKSGIVIGADSATVPYMVNSDSVGSFQDVNYARFTFKNPNGTSPNWNMMSHRHDTQTADNILALYHNLTFNGTSFNAKQVAGSPAWAMQFESRYDSAVEWNANLWTKNDNPASTYRRIFHMNAYYDSSAFGRKPGDVNWRWWTGRVGVFGLGFDAGGPTPLSGGNEDTTRFSFVGSGLDVGGSIRNYQYDGITSLLLADSGYGYLKLSQLGASRVDSFANVPLGGQSSSHIINYGFGDLFLGVNSLRSIYFVIDSTKAMDLSSGGMGLYGSFYQYTPSPQIQMVSSTDASRNVVMNFGADNGAFRIKHAYNIHLWPGASKQVLIGDSTGFDSTLTVNGGISSTNIKTGNINAATINAGQIVTGSGTTNKGVMWGSGSSLTDAKVTYIGDTTVYAERVRISANAATLALTNAAHTTGLYFRADGDATQPFSNRPWIRIGGGSNQSILINAGISTGGVYFNNDTPSGTGSRIMADGTAVIGSTLTATKLKVGSAGSVLDSMKVVGTDTLAAWVGGVRFIMVKNP